MLKFFITSLVFFFITIVVAAQSDTTLNFNKKAIPNGVKKCIVYDIKKIEMQTFFVAGLLKNNKLFFKPIINAKAIVVKATADSCTDNYVSINGKICSTSGGITGLGCGECSGTKTGKKITIKIIIK